MGVPDHYLVDPKISLLARMSSTLSPATHRASFALRDEQAARRMVDVLSEIFFEDEAAIAASERPDGRWDVAVHFADAPDQALVRELVGNAAGEGIAHAIGFDTIEAKDWVKASLEDLIPVPAGRFVVHGHHDRARVPANKIGIEIEAALAFGTGHHGTTRGCLLLLDHVLKARHPARVLDLGTGTGVLAIAAAKALHEPVLASDIDPPSVKVARENARSQRNRKLGAGDPRDRVFGAAICRARTVRPGAGEYPRQSVAAIGGIDGAASGAVGSGDLIGIIDPSGAGRRRRLSRTLPGAGAASCDRRLEQPAAALYALTLFRLGRLRLGAGDHALFLPQRPLDARLDKAIQNLDDDAALLLFDRRKRPTTHRRRNLLERKNRHGVSPRR